MNWLLGMCLGYIIHDAVQPTVVGKVLDKMSLPSDLIVAAREETSNAQNLV